MYDKLLGMLKIDVPDVERCNILVEKLIDFIEDDRVLEIETARDEGHTEGYNEGHEDGHSEGYDDGYDDGLTDAED